MYGKFDTSFDLNFRYQIDGVLIYDARLDQIQMEWSTMFIDDPKLCPVLVLKSYEERTQMYRRSSHSCKQLFNCYHWTQAEEPDEVWLE